MQPAAVNGSDAVLPPPPPPGTCAPDSVQTAPGEPCVDKYEGSLWDIPPGFRGGDWDVGTHASLSFGVQYDPSYAYSDIGFRCGR